MTEETQGGRQKQPPKIKLGSREFTLPASRIVRISIGVLLILGGILGFLPILGFWMVPLGILVISYDIAIARRWRRRFVVWWNGGGNGRRNNEARRNGTPDQ